jgi:hypothetical protein
MELIFTLCYPKAPNPMGEHVVEIGRRMGSILSLATSRIYGQLGKRVDGSEDPAASRFN